MDLQRLKILNYFPENHNWQDCYNLLGLNWISISEFDLNKETRVRFRHVWLLQSFKAAFTEHQIKRLFKQKDLPGLQLEPVSKLDLPLVTPVVWIFVDGIDDEPLYP